MKKWLNTINSTGRTYEDIYRECVIPSPCWMVWRTDLLKCGAFDSEQYPEDYDLCFRFYKNDLKAITVTKVLHYWRDHPQRTSRNDATYANQQYFNLKIPYFLNLDYDSNRPLVLWGAGKKGKVLAKKLLGEKTTFHWITNNPKKIGKDIYGVLIQKDSIIDQLKKPQLIIAVANSDEQEEIQQYFNKKKKVAGKDYFFFC